MSNVVLGGSVNGQAGQGDTVTITFSAAMNAQSFCGTWPAGSTTSTLGDTTNGLVAVTITDAGANDVLTVSTASGCAFSLGSVNLGGNYVGLNGTLTFSGNGNNGRSWITYTAGANPTLQIRLGSLQSGTALTVAAPGGVPSFVPSSSITSAGAITIAAGPFNGTASRF